MSQELQNIPAFWTALSHWIACTMFAVLLPGMKDRVRFWLTEAGILLLQIGFMYAIVDLDGLAFTLSYIVFALICLIPALVLNRLPLRAAVYYCARGFIDGAFASSLAWQLYIYLRQQHAALSRWELQAVFMLLVYVAVYAVLWMLERMRQDGLREMPISITSSVSTVFIAVAIYILSNLSFTQLGGPFVGSTYAEAFNIRTLVYFGGIAILYAHHIQIYETYIQAEVNVLHNMLDAQYAGFQAGQESIDLINRKYHDLKHQIAILRHEAGASKKMEYLDQMEREIQAYEAQNKTGNQTLDIILTTKSLHCQKQDIRLTCVADGAALSFMNEMDLCALFGNALDNAIEGVSRVPNPEERLIHLSVSREKGFVRIRLANRCAETPVMRSGIPQTSKKDKDFHGFGIKSIRAITEKYGGSMRIQAQEQWFELRLLIPVQPADG